MNEEYQERFQKLEAHLAHLEHQVDQLNEVIVDHGKLIERLRKEVQRQCGTLETLELDRIKSNTSKPPHYQ
jgi:SlyX protein